MPASADSPVAEAIKISEPYGVDVNSGCKNEKGICQTYRMQIPFLFNLVFY